MASINSVFHLKPINGIDIIDKLPDSGYKKRLLRDLGQIRDRNYQITTIYIDSLREDLSINVYDKVCDTIYTFVFKHSKYPFLPPYLQINYKSYLHFYKTKNEYVINEIEKYIGNKCMCCKSIICHNNWSPTNSLINIIEEHKYFRNIIKKNAYNAYVSVIKRKYLVCDIDLLSWLV